MSKPQKRPNRARSLQWDSLEERQVLGVALPTAMDRVQSFGARSTSVKAKDAIPTKINKPILRDRIQSVQKLNSSIKSPAKLNGHNRPQPQKAPPGALLEVPLYDDDDDDGGFFGALVQGVAKFLWDVFTDQDSNDDEDEEEDNDSSSTSKKPRFVGPQWDTKTRHQML